MWNYRIIKHKDKGPEWYGLHEVFYKKGKPFMWSKAEIIAGTPQELRETLKMMLKDARRKVPKLETTNKLQELKK